MSGRPGDWESIHVPSLHRPVDDVADLAGDTLSDVLRAFRLSGTQQFCVVAGGDWHVKADPAAFRSQSSLATPIPFHIVVEGCCWLGWNGEIRPLATGDIVIFPFGDAHTLGVGEDGPVIAPVRDLPARPWPRTPVLTYHPQSSPVRLICGFLHCDAMDFAPIRQNFAPLIHISGSDRSASAWLRSIVGQIVVEIECPSPGGLSVTERLTEILFIELIRHQISRGLAEGAKPAWLQALLDPPLARCLALIHQSPNRAWTLETLARDVGLSRSSLAERFETLLKTSPMRYLRAWRLHLASFQLVTTELAIATIAHEAGYGSEAAFNRAFSRIRGVPPATWRRTAGSA
jgi:AraC-like DNA-binding protein